VFGRVKVCDVRGSHVTVSLPTDWVGEYPASSAPNKTGSVAPSGPVITAGRTNVSCTSRFFFPDRSNRPLITASVRATTLAMPRTPVTPFCCAANGSAAPSARERVVRVARIGLCSGGACDRAGGGLVSCPRRRVTTPPPELVRLVDHRHLHGADIGSRRLAHRRGHRSTDEDEQVAGRAERGPGRSRERTDARARRVVDPVEATREADREVVETDGQVRRDYKREAHAGAALPRDGEAARAGTAKRDPL